MRFDGAGRAATGEWVAIGEYRPVVAAAMVEHDDVALPAGLGDEEHAGVAGVELDVVDRRLEPGGLEDLLAPEVEHLQAVIPPPRIELGGAAMGREAFDPARVL